jgi:hypothetical protein
MSEPSKPAMTMREIRERLGHTIPPDAPELPAAWVDGDPLMEAIAAAVWEHCETDGLSLVIDDPRNIAATAAAVARASSSAPVEFELRGTAEIRAAAFDEAANALAALGPEDSLVSGAQAWVEAVETLRRLAGEARDERETQAGTLAAALDGIHDLIATSSRDWGRYRVDAWLWAVLCGWDCEQTEHDETCTHGALEEMAQLHGWDDDTVAKARRYRAAVRAVTEPAAVAQQPQEADGDRIVAYSSPGGTALFCTRHRDELSPYWPPVFSEDLPDGGICAHSTCGADVLIPQQPEAAEGAQR